MRPTDLQVRSLVASMASARRANTAEMPLTCCTEKARKELKDAHASVASEHSCSTPMVVIMASQTVGPARHARRCKPEESALEQLVLQRALRASKKIKKKEHAKRRAGVSGTSPCARLRVGTERHRAEYPRAKGTLQGCVGAVCIIVPGGRLQGEAP